MTFQQYETADGQPVELLTFVNGSTVLRYTNANITLTIDALEYAPLEYKRNAPSISKDSDDSQIRLTLPSSNPVVNLYRNILQSTITSLTIERFHNNDPAQGRQVFWKGEIGSVTVNNALATVLATPLSQGTDEMPRYTYQGTCNYFLFESGSCGILRQDFKHESTITSINSTGLLIQVADLRTQAGIIDTGMGGLLTSDELDGYWLNGYIDVNGELRRIVNNPAGGTSPLSPDVIEIPYPLVNATAGQDITVYAGCSRTTDICRRKYNNLLSFGGFPTVPDNINPFETELPKGAKQEAAPGGGFWGSSTL
jgi:uncharacterized phage protein (TIGR02218 family)